MRKLSQEQMKAYGNPRAEKQQFVHVIQVGDDCILQEGLLHPSICQSDVVVSP